MLEVEEEDILEYITRLSLKKSKKITKGGKKAEGAAIGGRRIFTSVIEFMRITFNEYQRKARKWYNPFQNIPKPKNYAGTRDALPEDEILKLFEPGVLKSTMEIAVCATMFYSGLRRGEIYALRPDDLDFYNSKILVCQSWQRFGKKNKVLGPTKGKRERRTIFDPILQATIKKLWEENGKHEFVFCWKNGTVIGSSWIKRNFPKWLKRAGIELNGRKIVPHSSRHSLASLLLAKGYPLKYIQELLGHADLKTTYIYLHMEDKTIRDMGKEIIMAREQKPEEKRVFDFKVS